MISLKLKKIIYSVHLVLIFVSYSQILHIPKFREKSNMKQITSNIQEYFYNCYRKGFDTKILYTGDLITTKNKIDIFIGNHFNFLDFIIHQGLFKTFCDKELTYMYSKYMDNLRVIGRAFKYSNSLALNKKINLDIDNIKNYIEKNNNIVIYLNPEGTRITKDKLLKSQEYCKENSLPVFNNLLYPKMKGIYTIINELHKQDKLGNIIDFTVTVENENLDETLTSYLNNNLGNTYVCIKTYKPKYIEDYEKFKKWFIQIWENKEEFLDNYKDYEYEENQDKIKTSNKILTTLSILIFLYFIYIIYFQFYKSKLTFVSCQIR